MYGKSIGDTEAFQKVKSNWLYHQRQKHCCIQAALILQEPIDISPGIELLTTPSAAKAESALAGGDRGCIFQLYFLKWQYPLQKGSKPSATGAVGSFSSATSSPDWVLGSVEMQQCWLNCVWGWGHTEGWRRDSTSKPQFGLTFNEHERNWCIKDHGKTHTFL